jgi:glutathione S-transferase
MYKLYNVPGWGSMCVHFLLEEMDVPYQNIWMTPEQARAAEFRDISPLGLIPALGLVDGQAVFESAAIIEFLTASHQDKGLAPPVGTPDHGVYLAWLNYMSTNIYPLTNFGYNGGGFTDTPEQAASIRLKAEQLMEARLGLLETKLKSDGPFMAGSSYSALDMYLFMLAIWGMPSEAQVLENFPSIARICAEVRARPKLKAAIEAHGVMLPGSYSYD